MNQNLKSKLSNIATQSLYYIGAFLLPFVLLIFIFNNNNFGLFNLTGNTLISIDFQSQYIAYLRYYREMLIQDSFINVYTMSKVFGGDFMSIYTYYLSSPFLLFIRFIDEAYIPFYVLWMNIIKMSLAGVSMYALLSLSFEKNKVINVGFSTAYALLAYGFVYASNFMWLDAVMVLPLVILGLKLLFANKNPTLYILSLSYAFLTSWYMGALLTIFLILFFIAEVVGSKLKFKELFKVFIRFAIFSIIAAFISAPNWLTAISHFSGTKAEADLPTIGFLPFTMFFTGMFENGYETQKFICINTGYMPIFVSIGCIALAIMFFFNKGYNLNRRLAYLSLIIAYYLLSTVNVFNALMHGGREPTWFPARFAFVLSFFIVYLAALNYEKKKQTPIWGVAAPLTLLTIVIPIVINVPNTLLPTEYQTYSLSIPSLIIYISVVALLLLEKFLPKSLQKNTYVQPVINGVLLVLLLISSYRGGDTIIKNNLETSNYYQSYSKYLADDKLADFINEDWNSTYRVATTFNRDGAYNSIDNNPMFYGFNGLSNYSSSSKKNVESYMTKLGFHYNGYFTKYDGGSTLSMNSLLGVKYIYDENDDDYSFLDSDGISLVDSNEDYSKYENTYALSLGFYSKKTSASYIGEGERKGENNNVYWFDQIEYQNQIFKTLSGLDEDIFKPLEEVDVSVTGGSYTTDEFGLRKYTSDGPGLLRIRLKFKYDGPINSNYNFYYVEKSGIDSTVYLNHDNLGVSSYWNKGIRNIDIVNNNPVTLEYFPKNEISNKELRPKLYVEDLTVLKKHLDLIQDKTLNLTTEKDIFNTSFNGKITTDGTMDNLVITLPYEENLHVKIDGREVDTELKFNVFTAIDINQLDNGEHDIEIYYRDNGLIAGFTCTIIGNILGSGVCLYYCLDKEKQTKLKKKLNIFKKENN